MKARSTARAKAPKKKRAFWPKALLVGAILFGSAIYGYSKVKQMIIDRNVKIEMREVNTQCKSRLRDIQADLAQEIEKWPEVMKRKISKIILAPKKFPDLLMEHANEETRKELKWLEMIHGEYRITPEGIEIALTYGEDTDLTTIHHELGHVVWNDLDTGEKERIFDILSKQENPKRIMYIYLDKIASAEEKRRTEREIVLHTWDGVTSADQIVLYNYSYSSFEAEALKTANRIDLFYKHHTAVAGGNPDPSFNDKLDEAYRLIRRIPQDHEQCQKQKQEVISRLDELIRCINRLCRENKMCEDAFLSAESSDPSGLLPGSKDVDSLRALAEETTKWYQGELFARTVPVFMSVENEVLPQEVVEAFLQIRVEGDPIFRPADAQTKAHSPATAPKMECIFEGIMH